MFAFMEQNFLWCKNYTWHSRSCHMGYDIIGLLVSDNLIKPNPWIKPEACFTTKYSGMIFHDACAVCHFDPCKGCRSCWRHTVWRQQQNILPESGITDFCDAGPIVGQSGAASLGSGDVGKLSGGKTERICKNECRKPLVKQYFTEWKT